MILVSETGFCSVSGYGEVFSERRKALVALAKQAVMIQDSGCGLVGK